MLQDWCELVLLELLGEQRVHWPELVLLDWCELAVLELLVQQWVHWPELVLRDWPELVLLELLGQQRVHWLVRLELLGEQRVHWPELVLLEFLGQQGVHWPELVLQQLALLERWLERDLLELPLQGLGLLEWVALPLEAWKTAASTACRGSAGFRARPAKVHHPAIKSNNI